MVMIMMIIIIIIIIHINIITMLGMAEPDKVFDDVQSERIIMLLYTTTEH